jgi:hypothetical protein
MNPKKAKDGLRNALIEQYEILKALPSNQRELALNIIRSALHAADQAGYEQMSPERMAGLERLRLQHPSFPDACVEFLSGCLAGTLAFDDFDQWFKSLFD